MTDVHGFCDERFRPLEDALRCNLDRGLDKGASLAVTLGGEVVVDLWGGTRDYQQATPWEADTVVRVFSTSKVVVMIAALMLVDRGELDLDEPIATYWPEFAQHGKGAITTRHVLVHRSGLPGYGRAMSVDELGDVDLVNELLAGSAPWYEPGTVSCYHAGTFGSIIAEITRRISGVSFEEFCRREITSPVGADFAYQLPSDRVDGLAALWPPTQHDSEGTAATPSTPPSMGDVVMAEYDAGGLFHPRSTALVIPAGSGMASARGLARIGSIVAAPITLDGRTMLSRSIVAEAGTEQSFDTDLILGQVRYGLGFGLDSPFYRAPTASTVHWGGWGGSFLTMDPVSGISCGFAPNQLVHDAGFGRDERRSTLWKLLGEITDQHFRGDDTQREKDEADD